MNFKVLICAALASVLAVAGCSDDTTNGTGGTAGTAGGAGVGGAGGEGGGTPVAINCDTDLPDPSSYVVGEVFEVPETTSDDCTGEIFMPGADAANRLNARLENAGPQDPPAEDDDVICLAEGTYVMDLQINISAVPGLTVKGIGDSPDDTELLFGGPGTGKGIFVQTNDVAIENLHIRNTGANGIEQDGTTGSVFRKVNVSWDDFCDTLDPPENCGNACTEDADCDDVLLACEDDACVGDQGKNGAYGIYPTNCEDTLVEYSQATNASDAGIYIGKCGWLDDSNTGGIVRYNIAANNVAGLEVENCLDVVAHDNLVFGNTGGLMPLQQPISADRPANTGILMEDNKVYCNNGKNFAETGVVQIIPVGSGLLSLGGQGVEIRNNDVQGNDTLGLAVVSSALTCAAAGADCKPYSYPYNPYAEMIYAHDNYYLNNGTNADTSGDFGILFRLLGVGTPEKPTEDVLWDGFIRDVCDLEGAPANCYQTCDCEGDFAAAKCGDACDTAQDCFNLGVDEGLVCDANVCVPAVASDCEDELLTCGDQSLCVAAEIEDPGICLGSDFDGTYRDLTSNVCPGSDPPNPVLWGACVSRYNTTDTAGRLCDLDLGFN